MDNHYAKQYRKTLEKVVTLSKDITINHLSIFLLRVVHGKALSRYSGSRSNAVSPFSWKTTMDMSTAARIQQHDCSGFTPDSLLAVDETKIFVNRT